LANLGLQNYNSNFLLHLVVIVIIFHSSSCDVYVIVVHRRASSYVVVRRYLYAVIPCRRHIPVSSLHVLSRVASSTYRYVDVTLPRVLLHVVIVIFCHCTLSSSSD